MTTTGGSLERITVTAVSPTRLPLTASKCPDDADGLRSCACTKDANSASLWTSISSSVIWSCNSGAVEDVKSASELFSQYCNPAANTAYTTPAAPAVSDYIWDISAFSDLAPCAGSALSNVVGRMTSSLCHDDPTALASCVCTKNQHSRSLSTDIKSSVQWSCGSTATDDISSALAIWDGYCQLGNGKSSFPTPSPLAGTVTYNIWDLPMYSSLVPCAASALSRQLTYMTSSLCPAGPASLVSCVCAKDRKSSDFSRDISTTVAYSCGTNARADISSAQAVFAYYCSAGNGLVTPQGITVAAVTGPSTGRTSSGTGRCDDE
ncbi:hypothetical protein BKA65DRAFT_562540 [Rhexocercosporidium sp. MPI-PUGE-AT-0058]|nr:hypothetical protein BKA65DRAFT_562540 [Rhexocercosporidium sp. MPI-PUGE-AT-0058]